MYTFLDRHYLHVAQSNLVFFVTTLNTDFHDTSVGVVERTISMTQGQVSWKALFSFSILIAL